MNLLPCAHCGKPATTPWEVKVPGIEEPQQFTRCPMMCNGSTAVRVEVWQTRAQVFEPALRRAMQDLLSFYDDVQATAGRLRSSDQWIILEGRAKVLRQALRDTVELNLCGVEEMLTELKENEGVIKCLRRHRDEAEQALSLSRETVEAMRVTSETLHTTIWEVIEALESGIFNDTPKLQLELAHKLRHALPTETKP
jgi:hypothetical protein